MLKWLSYNKHRSFDYCVYKRNSHRFESNSLANNIHIIKDCEQS